MDPVEIKRTWIVQQFRWSRAAMSRPEGHFLVFTKTGRSTDVAPTPSPAMKSKFLDVNNKNFGSQVISIVVAAALVLLIGVWVCVWLFGARRRRQTAPAYDVENFGTQQQVDARRGGIKGGKGGSEVSSENHNDAGRVALVLMAGEEAPTFLAHPTPYLKSSEGIICTREKESPPQQWSATDRQE